MIIAAIVAIDLNHAIGKNNQLLWHLPADLKFFKQTTMGCPIIMGRKTYQSIGKLLPGRKNIIITRNEDFKIEGAEIYQSLNDAISKCDSEKVFVIGGAEIYTLAMPMIKELYITIVKNKFDADTFFSKINTSQFNLVWEECHEADEKNKFDYCFQKWIRN
jgi:dihydrofolate reductase